MSRDESMNVVVKLKANGESDASESTHNGSQNEPTSEINSGCPRKYRQHSFHIKSPIGLTMELTHAGLMT